ncbi:MAG: hypothetical protein AAFS10_18980 [Myxococcota bacterium]
MMQSKRVFSVYAMACLMAVLPGLVGCGEDSETEGETAEGTIGTEGGVVSHSSGLMITIPDGALTANTELSVTQVVDPATTLPAPPEGFTYVSGAFEFLPHGQTFERAVDVAMPLESSNATDIRIVRLDDLSDTTWEEVSGASFTSAGAAFAISSFSVYAAIGSTETVSANNGTTGSSNATTPQDTSNGTTPDEPVDEPTSEPASEPSSNPGG